MSKDKPYWKENVPIWTDKAVLEDLFIEAHDRLISDKVEAELTAKWKELSAAINNNEDALVLCGDIETIYREMLHDTCFLLAALAPHLACKPLTHESLLTDAIKAGLDNPANDKEKRTVSKDDALWEGFPLEGPDDILNFLALEGVDRLLEPAYAEARTELENRLKSLVSSEAWKVYLVLDELVGEFWVDIVGLLSKLVPALVRSLEARTLMGSESFEEVFQAAVLEAGVSPKKSDEIQALEGLDAFGVSSVTLRRRAAAKLNLKAAESV